ncbi:MAG TPA: hypothetical protein VGM51_11495 [Armatimonadota bacterium]
MKLGIFIAAGVLALGTAAFASNNAATSNTTVPVNLTVSPYVFAAFAVDASYNTGWDTTIYGANLANNKAGFSITVDGNGGSGSDTVNVAWVDNGPSTIKFDLDLGSGATALPGSWLMQFDGAPVAPPLQTLITTNPTDNNKKILVPMTLTVNGITTATATGSYVGTMKITAATNP